MKIALILFLVLIAIGSFVIGMIAGADPEGRGADTTVNAWIVSLLAIFGIVAAGVLL
jgi:hypothetical protein